MSSSSLWSQDGWNEEEIVRARGAASSACTSSSRSHYSVEPESCPWTQHAETVETSFGDICVTMCGEASCPALLTYHDIGLNHSTCFQGLLLCEETAAILLQNFCIYHLDAPGHEADASEGDPDDPFLSAENLADQAAEVAAHYGLTGITCLGVSSGAYVMTLMAIRHPKLVKGLVLVSPVCRAATWAEWANVKMLMTTLSYYGMARHVKDYLLERYFCQDQSGYHGPGTDALLAFRRELDERDPESVMRYMSAMHHRKDLTGHLGSIQARMLVIVGALSPFLDEARHLVAHTNPSITRYHEIAACGSLVTEERPQAMQDAMRSFCRQLLPSLLKGRGYQASPERWLSSRIHSSLGWSSQEISPSHSDPSTPSTPRSSYFCDGRSYVARSPKVVAFEELSLASIQHRLKPVKTKREMPDSESDMEGGESGAVSSICGSAAVVAQDNHTQQLQLHVLGDLMHPPEPQCAVKDCQ